MLNADNYAAVSELTTGSDKHGPHAHVAPMISRARTHGASNKTILISRADHFSSCHLFRDRRAAAAPPVRGYACAGAQPCAQLLGYYEYSCMIVLLLYLF